MKIIVPMAGMGKRMRPHTLSIPKPLIKVAGKSIVQRLVEDITEISKDRVDEIAFIIGDFGEQVESDLKMVAESLGAKASIYYQHEALGTAHAILCAKESLDGKVVVAFADTLFKGEFEFDPNADGILWVKSVEDPSAFGVVKLNEKEEITDFVEKPSEFVSDLAMIGIYYFKDGQQLKEELQYLIDNDVIKGGEYQLPDALRNMLNKGTIFKTGKVEEWLDCGNKDATTYSNQRVLHHIGDDIATDLVQENSSIISPCYIGKGVKIKNSVVGPYVSIGDHSEISDARIENSIIQDHSNISSCVIDNSMIGHHAEVEGEAIDLSLSDYSKIKA